MIHSVLHYSIVLAAAAMCMYRNQPHPLHRPVPTPPTYIAHFFLQSSQDGQVDL